MVKVFSLKDKINKFDANRIVSGIDFHVIEIFGKSLELHSKAETLQRLQDQNTKATVYHKVWKDMSSEQRLRWLLRQARVSIRYSELNPVARLVEQQWNG
jgi:hypothetical protein